MFGFKKKKKKKEKERNKKDYTKTRKEKGQSHVSNVSQAKFYISVIY